MLFFPFDITLLPSQVQLLSWFLVGLLAIAITYLGLRLADKAANRMVDRMHGEGR